MRKALVIVTLVLLAATVLAPASSAAVTKYKPCTLLGTKEIETALGAKQIPGPQGMLEDENIEADGPLQGQPVDFCIWKLTGAGATVGGVATAVVLWAARAIGPLPQLASFWYPPKEELVKGGGGTVESVKLPGAECRIFKNLKVPSAPVGHQTWCLISSKGVALALEIDTYAKTPFAPQLAKQLLDRASSRLH